MIYTVSKTILTIFYTLLHQRLADFGKKAISLSRSKWNFATKRSHISHRTSNASLQCLIKYWCQKTSV